MFCPCDPPVNGHPQILKTIHILNEIVVVDCVAKLNRCLTIAKTNALTLRRIKLHLPELFPFL